MQWFWGRIIGKTKFVLFKFPSIFVVIVFKNHPYSPFPFLPIVLKLFDL